MGDPLIHVVTQVQSGDRPEGLHGGQLHGRIPILQDLRQILSGTGCGKTRQGPGSGQSDVNIGIIG